MVELTEGTWQRIELLFPEEEWQEVGQTLANECADNLPLWRDATPERLERVRFAVLKLSDGHMEIFRKAVTLAKRDWRDVLVASGFGSNITEHTRWVPGRRPSK